MLLVADRSLITQMFPALAQAADRPKPLVDHLVSYALSGLEALAVDEPALSQIKEGRRRRL
jgi:hypothetical protein